MAAPASTAAAAADYTAPQLTAAAAASVAALNRDAKSNATAAAAKPVIAATDHIYLVGDSVLDNFIWLAHPATHNLHEQLKAMASDSKTIHNFAVDESVSADVLHGKTPGFPYVAGRKEFGLEPYPVSAGGDGKVHPLDLIAAHASATFTAANPSARGLAVVSVGGNDARVQLQHFARAAAATGNLSDGLAAVLSAMETPGKHTGNGFSRNLSDICDRLRALAGGRVHTVLVMCYLPHKSFGPQLRQPLQALAEHVSRTVVWPLAARAGVPVIDLSRTFDPDNGAHYGRGGGSSPIEPSDLSTAFIARLVAAVANDFKFGTDQSKIYYGADAITIEPNPAVAALKAGAKPGAVAAASGAVGAGAAAAPAAQSSCVAL